MARICYLELPVRDVVSCKAFYGAAFDWDFTDFGPDYASTMSGDSDLGLNGDPSQWTTQLLPVISVEDLEDSLERVEHAGGTVTLPIFSFPGGRRFHFRDPAGHELAVMQAE